MIQTLLLTKILFFYQAVIIHEVKFFYHARQKKLTAPTRTNHLLILNLAVADLLMGIYLLMLGIAGATLDGVFCAHQYTWRSGITCQAMGSLVVISSETSVITMVMLASFRLFAVYQVNCLGKLETIILEDKKQSNRLVDHYLVRKRNFTHILPSSNF